MMKELDESPYIMDRIMKWVNTTYGMTGFEYKEDLEDQYKRTAKQFERNAILFDQKIVTYINNRKQNDNSKE